MAVVRLRCRNAFRTVLEDVKERYVAALKAHGPAGGSLWARVSKIKIVLKARHAKWPVSEAGQELTWFVRGTKHQRDRPVEEEIDEQAAQAAVAEELAAVVDRYDREAR